MVPERQRRSWWRRTGPKPGWRPLACSASAAVGLTTSVLGTWALSEVAAREHPTLGAALACVLLALGWGAAIGLATHRIARPRWLALVLVLPVPLLQIGELWWAARRAADLWPPLGNVSVWIVAILLAAVVGGLGWLLLRRPLGPGRFWPIFLASVLAVLALVTSLFPLQGRAPVLGVGVLVALGCAVVVLLASEWRQSWVAAAGLLACIGALAWIPSSYARLYQAFAGAGLGFAVLLARRLWRRRRGDRRGPWWEVAVLGAVCVLALAGASRLVDTDDSVWRDHPREKSLLAVLVRFGQRASDFDGDGHAMIFGQWDCAPFDGRAHPGAHEVPGNALDENCRGGAEPAGTAQRIRQAEAINPPPSPWRSDGDVVLVVVDTLRYDDAMDPSLAPSLSALAEEATVFERAYASSTFTSMSLMALLSGRLPTGYPLKWVGRFNAHPAEPPDGLGRWLEALGWDTALAGASNEEENDYFGPDAFGHGFGVRELGSLDDPAARTTELAVRAWQQLDPRKPRLLWAHYMWVHKPREREGYRRAVRETDAAIGELRDRVGEQALWIVTSDHGEEFGEHGGENHAQTLYEEVVHVPLLVQVPGRPGRRESRLSPLRSIPATVMALLRPDLAPAGEGPYLCLGQPGCRDLPVPMALEMQRTHQHGLVLGRHHVIRDVGRASLVGFDLRADPKEATTLEPPPDEVVERLTWWEETLIGQRSAEHHWPYRDPAF